MLRTEVTRHLASGWPLFNHFFLKTEFFVNGHVTRQRVSEPVVLFPLRPEPSTGRRLTRPSCPLAGWLLSSPNPPRLRWPLVALRAPAPRLCFTRPPTPLPLPPTARWLRGGFLNISSPGTHFPLSRGAGPPRVSSHGRERGERAERPPREAHGRDQAQAAAVATTWLHRTPLACAVRNGGSGQFHATRISPRLTENELPGERAPPPRVPTPPGAMPGPRSEAAESVY